VSPCTKPVIPTWTTTYYWQDSTPVLVYLVLLFSWLHSHLTGRSQCVRAGQSSSTFKHCSSGVSQGSVLGPLLFTTYISPISNIASNFGVSLQQYADDTQLHLCTAARDLAANLNTLESCLTSLHAWFCHNRLGLNSGKSESILFGTSTRLRNFSPLATSLLSQVSI